MALIRSPMGGVAAAVPRFRLNPGNCRLIIISVVITALVGSDAQGRPADSSPMLPSDFLSGPDGKNFLPRLPGEAATTGGPAGSNQGQTLSRAAGWDRVSSQALPADRSEFDFDFRNGPQGWTGDFTDYAWLFRNIYALTFSYLLLPDYLAAGRSALFLSGANHSDDLFMFIKGPIRGLEPATNYRVVFQVEIATNAPSGCGGIGGPPGEAVHVKAGALTWEPLPLITEPWPQQVIMNVDKGNQAAGGKHAIVLGHVGKTSDDPCSDWTFEFKLLTSQAGPPFSVTTGENGMLWVFVGTDSGYEGTTSVYYTRVRVTLDKVFTLGDLNEDLKRNATDLAILANFLAGNCPPGSAPFTAPLAAADLNGDAEVTAADLQAFASWLAGG